MRATWTERQTREKKNTNQHIHVYACFGYERTEKKCVPYGYVNKCEYVDHKSKWSKSNRINNIEIEWELHTDTINVRLERYITHLVQKKNTASKTEKKYIYQEIYLIGKQNIKILCMKLEWFIQESQAIGEKYFRKTSTNTQIVYKPIACTKTLNNGTKL